MFPAAGESQHPGSPGPGTLSSCSNAPAGPARSRRGAPHRGCRAAFPSTGSRLLLPTARASPEGGAPSPGRSEVTVPAPRLPPAPLSVPQETPSSGPRVNCAKPETLGVTLCLVRARGPPACAALRAQSTTLVAARDAAAAGWRGGCGSQSSWGPARRRGPWRGGCGGQGPSSPTSQRARRAGAPSEPRSPHLWDGRSAGALRLGHRPHMSLLSSFWLSQCC